MLLKVFLVEDETVIREGRVTGFPGISLDIALWGKLLTERWRCL